MPEPPILAAMTDTFSTPDRRLLRIAQVAPPLEPVPPPGYGGTERIVDALIGELVARGHDVTLFAPGDSTAPASRLIPTVPRALRPGGQVQDPWAGYLVASVMNVLRRADEFDVIHSHLEWISLLLARTTRTPVVMTFHGRLDLPFAADALSAPPLGLVAISRSQAAAHPHVPWAGVIHNGLDLTGAPFEQERGEDLCFVGRVAPEKGIVDAIEVARLSGRRLRVAAKVGRMAEERAYYSDVFMPATKTADVELLGELSGDDRDRLLGESYATLMPGSWPEPFGLVAIESLACGTPVLARPAGALPEIIRDGIDGYFGQDAAALAERVPDVADLDRAAIRASVLERFSAARMTDGYEAVYRRFVSTSDRTTSQVVVDQDREREAELSAAGRPGKRPDPPAHRLDERPADEQPDARAGGLGGGRRRSVVELEEPPDLG
jgi:glycosyltransferase involved in cell wall biosynthesis